MFAAREGIQSGSPQVEYFWAGPRGSLQEQGVERHLYSCSKGPQMKVLPRSGFFSSRVIADTATQLEWAAVASTRPPRKVTFLSLQKTMTDGREHSQPPIPRRPTDPSPREQGAATVCAK